MRELSADSGSGRVALTAVQRGLHSLEDIFPWHSGSWTFGGSQVAVAKQAAKRYVVAAHLLDGDAVSAARGR